MGQTGICIYKRLMEHSNSREDGSGKHLPVHCRSSVKCKPILDKMKVSGQAKDQRAREILDASATARHGPDRCVNESSVYLFKKEVGFLV